MRSVPVPRLGSGVELERKCSLGVAGVTIRLGPLRFAMHFDKA